MAEACVNLSEMCRLGMGTPDGEPRRDEARQWLDRAVGLGNDMAKDLLKVMDAEEEAVAQEEARLKAVAEEAEAAKGSRR